LDTRQETRAIVGYPAKFGTAVDSFTSEYLNQKLNNNEKNIKNQIGGVYSDK